VNPDPADAEAVLAVGRAALAKGREEDALPLVAEAARRQPDHVALHLLLARLHRALDALTPAIAACDRAARLAPGDAGIAQLRAGLHLEAGRPAASLFDAALALAPGDQSLRFGRVSALLAEQRADAALAALEAALDENPLWVEGHRRLANLRWQAGRKEDFTARLEEALAEAPRQLALWGVLFMALGAADRHEAMLAAARRGRAAAGAHLMFDANEAAALDAMGQTEAAVPLFEALASVADPVVAHFRVRHLLRRKEIEAAAALAESWLTRPEREMFVAYLGAAWRLLGDPRAEWLEGDPRLVGIYEPDIGPLDALADMLRDLHRQRGQPLDQSVRGGSQTEGALFTLEALAIGRLRAGLVAAVQAHIAQLPPPDRAHPTLSAPRDRPVRFAGSWSVRLTGAGHHVVHRHQQGWLSSACYVALPDEAERGPAPAGWLALGEPPPELGLDLAPARLIEPLPGRLVLFPSTMWHGTRPFGAGERLSIAFDVAPPR